MDLSELDDEPKKKNKPKKDKKNKPKAVVVEEEVDETVPWKGKSSSFFEMKVKEGPPEDMMNNPNNYEMVEDQWNFIFKYYPEYGAAPHSLMLWLYG